MNGRQVRNVLRLLQRQWGFEKEINSGFLQKENDVFLVTRDADKIELNGLNVNSLGLYFGELRHDQLRLSIEGSQLVGHHSTKNVLDLNPEQLRQWLAGEDLETKEQESCNSFVIVRNSEDFFGCGKMKEGTLLNFLPKSRRLSVSKTSQF